MIPQDQMPQDGANPTVMQAWRGKFQPRALTMTPAVSPPSNSLANDTAYWRGYALARTCLNREVLANVPRASQVLEVGVDKGVQLRCLHSMGFFRTAGTHIHFDVMQLARRQAPTTAGVQASALHLPFADSSFDLVCTSGLLATLCDGRMERLMRELHRCSRRWLWGWERLELGGNAQRVHLAGEPPLDLATAWRDAYPDLRLVRAHWLPTPMPGGGFQTYLLEKTGMFEKTG